MLAKRPSKRLAESFVNLKKCLQTVGNELRRAKDVLKHLKRKVGTNVFDEEYKVVMQEIKEALGEATSKEKEE